MELNTIKTTNSRKLYIPYYALFVLLIFGSFSLFFRGALTIQAVGASLILVLLGVGGTEIHRLGQSYEVNPLTVIHTKGYLSRHSRRIDLFAINDVAISQTFFQRLINIGDVHVRVANATHQTVLSHLHAPKLFAQTIERNMQRIRKHGPALDEENKERDISRPKEESDAEIFERLQEI